MEFIQFLILWYKIDLMSMFITKCWKHSRFAKQQLIEDKFNSMNCDYFGSFYFSYYVYDQFKLYEFQSVVRKAGFYETHPINTQISIKYVWQMLQSQKSFWIYTLLYNKKFNSCYYILIKHTCSSTLSNLKILC